MAQTANYQLPLHEPYTRLTQEVWDENQKKLDAIFTALNSTINTKASQTSVNSSVNSLSNRINTLNARAETIIGSYTGDGESSQKINLGFTPKAVLVEVYAGTRMNSGILLGGLALPSIPVGNVNGNSVELTTGGFIVSKSTHANLNTENSKYVYLAFK